MIKTDTWDRSLAPSLAEFEALAARAYARLPAPFRALCDQLVIRVEDFPADEVLDEMEIESAYDLLGLFTGVGLAQDGALPESGRLPNTVHLYRRPILDYWAEHEETLGAIVTHVLVHEIGHHFGLSDDDMARIEGDVA
jgi:predicted Zn-dependent protease with MMP-like domain